MGGAVREIGCGLPRGPEVCPSLHLGGGLLTSGPQARGFPTVGLSFLKCEVGIIKGPSLQGCGED